MKFIGYGFVRGDAPLQFAYLPLSDLTVIVGANDVGKSRLLTGFAAHLAGDPALSSSQESAAFFVELEDQEVTNLERFQAPPGAGLEPNEAGPPAFGLPPELVEAASKSRIAVVVSRLHGDPADTAFRCLDSSHEAMLPERWRAYRAVAPHLVMVNAEIPTGAALWAPGAPIAAVPLAPEQLPPLPVPVSLPVDPDRLEAEVISAIRGLVATSDLLEGEIEGLDLEAADDDLIATVARNISALLRRPTLCKEIESHEGWVEIDEDSLVLNEKVRALAEAVGDAANELLPEFIAEAYRVRVEPQLPSPFHNRSPILLGLQGRTGQPHRFDQVAEGFQLWTQLAVLEGVDVLRSAEGRLWLVAELVGTTGAAFEDARAVESDKDDPVDVEWPDEARGKLLDALRALLEELSDVQSGVLPTGTRPEGPGQPAGVWKLVAGGQLGARLAFLQPRLYVIDEPERHLHPAVERSVAPWLAHAMRERRSQCIVATHAVPFFNLSGEVSYSLIRRDDDGTSVLEPFEPSLLTALNETAADVGYNRGELLANTALLLFVEGRADQKVLEALYLKRLFKAGIAVFPMHSALSARGVVDSEVLLRYTTARVAVLLDDLALDEITRLQNDEEFLQAALSSRRTTLNQLAQLVKNARVYGREVQPFGIPGPDIFDMLDEQTLQELFPRFPGHAAANAEWAAAPKNIKRKDFYERRYDMPQGVDTLYVPVADQMRERARIPADLDAVMDEIERYAL